MDGDETLIDRLTRAACFGDGSCACESPELCRDTKRAVRSTRVVLRALAASPELSEPTRQELRAVLEESERG